MGSESLSGTLSGEAHGIVLMFLRDQGSGKTEFSNHPIYRRTAMNLILIRIVLASTVYQIKFVLVLD